DDGDLATIGRNLNGSDAVVRERILINEALDGSDGNRLGAGDQDARAFAQLFLRTHSGTNFGHVARGTRELGRLEKPALRRKREPFGDTIVQRACLYAGRIRA